MASCCASLAGSLKKRVTIQSMSRAADGQGGFTETWADVATAWASIEPVKAYERYQAMQNATPISHKLVMRFRRDVSTGCRLVYQGRVFDVKEVINLNEESRFLSIKAIETESVALVPDISLLALRSGGYLLLRDGGRILLRA